MFEYLYVEPQAWLYKNMPLPVKGTIAIPDGPGLGIDPDPDILAAFGHDAN
jgi:L-alanine-DL-glutamate epimerase-like enolase superfamily enzyme